MEIHLFNETKKRVNKELTSKIERTFNGFKTALRNSSVNLIMYSPQSITKLNKQLFKRNNPTDVISTNQPILRHFDKLSAQDKQPLASLGDIYICPSVIKQNAKKYKVSYNEELARAIIHGILHLLGYDHKKAFGESSEEMFKVQEALIERLNL